jgi:transposase
MPKSLSGDLRERVIEAVQAGASRREAAERFEISASAAVKWLQRWRDHGALGGGDQPDRLPALATELVSRKVTILYTVSNAAAYAAKAATSTIPTVFLTGGDPVEIGLVASL